MKHHAARAGAGGGGGSHESQSDVIRGRTPIIFNSESGSDSSSSTTQGYPDQRDRNPIRRPPPYRTVPLSLTLAGNCANSANHASPARPQPASAKPVHPRARSVPPKSHVSGHESGQCSKPVRPKSIHQEFPFTQQPRRLAPPTRSSSHHFNQLPQQPQRPAQTRCFPLRSSVSHSSFPQSVSLQFDSLLPEWSESEAPVPSPAPTERRGFVRPSRTSHALDRVFSAPRSSSVPRSQSSPSHSVNSLSLGNRHQRPLSHPAGPQAPNVLWSHSSHPALELQSQENLLIGLRHSSLLTARSHGHLDHRQHQQPAVSSCSSLGRHHSSSASSVTLHPAPGPRWPPNCFSNGLAQLASATPAPAPSPTSTPSPSSRPLAHLPTDALRTNHGIRILEKKLDLYVDIIQAQERFVQVSERLSKQSVTKLCLKSQSRASSERRMSN